MTIEKKTTGTLYVVATPIGNLTDISQRALNILQTVDCIAAEDTRHSQHLLQHFAIHTSLLALHDHNESERVDKLIAMLQSGKNLALISDAGTPLISDPGYRLVKKARAEGITTVPIPGACALITALSVAGLPTDRFIFEGFLPAKFQAREQRLQKLQQESRTLIFYESPHRIVETIQTMRTVFGEERLGVIARELTKTFETIHTASLKALHEWLLADSDQQRGEFVILLQGFSRENETEIDPENLRILTLLLKELPLKQAVQLAVKITGEKKNKLYDWALTSNSVV